MVSMLSQTSAWKSQNEMWKVIIKWMFEVNLYAFFISNDFFSTQPQCCLTFSWIENWASNVA